MVDHCENCNCANVKKYWGMEKFWYIKLLMMCGIPFLLGTSFLVFYVIWLECSSRWSQPEYVVCGVCYSCFIICYILMYQVTKPFEYMGLLILCLFECLWEFICRIWNTLRLPTWSDIRLIFSIFSMTRTIARAQTKQDISISHNESNEDRPPPLPPKNRKMMESAGTTMFQKLTPNVSQGASSSTSTKDDSPDLTSSLFQRPHCSKQSAPLVESSGRRGKKLSKRGHFKNRTSKETKLNNIHKEGLYTQGASEFPISFPSFTQMSASDSETEQETSFTTKPHQSRPAEQGFGYVSIAENDKPAPTHSVYGVESQAKTSSTRGKQTDPDQISSSSRSTKKQLPTDKDFFIQSLEKSTSEFFSHLTRRNPTSTDKKLGLINAPVSKFGTFFQLKDEPLSTLENVAQEQTFADMYFRSQREVKESGIQCQSSANYMRLPESESQSWAFDMRGTEGNEKCHPPPESAELQVLPSQTQKQSSAVAFSDFQEQSRLPDIQKSQGNRDKAAANYIKLPQLEAQLKVSDIRTEMKQSSPDHSAISDFQTSLQGHVSSMPGIHRMLTYQEQTSSEGPQRQGRISDVQKRRSSRKHNPIPIYRKSSESESESEEERLNIQQPMQTCDEFSLAKSQLQTLGIGEIHEYFTQEIEMQEGTLQKETFAPRTSGICKTLLKLKHLQRVSAAGFPEATIQTRHIDGGQEPPLSADYAKKQFRGKARRVITQKRWRSLSLGLEIPIRESNVRRKRTELSIESTSLLAKAYICELENTSIHSQQVEASGGGYLRLSILSSSEGNLTQAHLATTPLSGQRSTTFNKRNEGEKRIGQRSWRDPLHLKEGGKQETQRKETFLTLDMATGGVVLSKDRRVENESEADSSEPPFIFDQSMNVLDLSHIEVPLLPKHITPSKEKVESQNSEIAIRRLSIKTRRTERSAESTSQLFPCDTGGLVTSGIQRQQIEASAGGYLPHSTLSLSGVTPSQEHMTTIPLKKGKECEDVIGQRSSTDPSHVKEEDKEETQRTEAFMSDMTRGEQETQGKETFLPLDLATGGLVFSKDGAEDESEADSSEPSFTLDQSLKVLDLSHIEMPFLPAKDIKTSKDKNERQN